MASYAMDDFVGNGVLKGLLPKLLEEGCNDVPTLKIMDAEDMNMTHQQKDALEIRSYLHDRALMQYADILEASEKSLSELLNLSAGDLSSQFGMKRGHIARFMDRTSAFPDPMSKLQAPLERNDGSKPSRNNSFYQSYAAVKSAKMQRLRSSQSRNDKSIEQSLAYFKISDGYTFKGIVAAGPAEARACGCVQPPAKIAPYSSIENVSLHKLTPEYKIGMERLMKTKTPPTKASELWREKPAVILCIRRPGCIMCRAEAHQLYAKKPIFDALGFQLIAVLHEYIESEVKDFWPRYWGGVVAYDQGMGFFRALGGGKLLKDKFLTGFLLNPRAIANYKRAKAIGIQQNFKGEGEIKGGLFIVGRGKSGIAYQFIERNFGDWAPLVEVIEICARMQSQQQDRSESIKASQE